MSAPVSTPAPLPWALPLALLGWVAGVALQLRQAQLWPLGVYLALLALGLLLGLLAWRRRVGGWPWLLAAALAAFAICGWRVSAVATLEPGLQGRDLVLTGLISAMPQRAEGGWRFHFDVESAQLDAQPVRLPPRVQLSWYTPWPARAEPAAEAPPLPALRAGQRWRLTARLKAVHGNFNPHGFDYELWQWEQGVRATGYVRTGPRATVPELLHSDVAYPVQRWRQSVRDRMLTAVAESPEEGADKGLAGILAALVTGDQAVIERADWDVFRATGVAHLMSISGLHITMFAWLAAGVLGVVWRASARWPATARLSLWLPAPLAALLGGLLLAGAYAVFSGWGVPAQRTVLMLATLTALRALSLRWPWWMGWLLAAAVVLGFDPWALYQPGFWLSFVAVAVLFAASADEARTRGLSLAGRALALLREQWVVTLALTPLTLLLFGQASVVGLLANLLAIPWVTLLITPLALLGVLWAPLWPLAADCLAPLAGLLRAMAQWPWASVSMAAAPGWLGAAAVAGGVLLAMPWSWRLRAAGLPLLLPLLLWQPARPAPGQFELLAVDVGQGSAVLVRTATHSLLYDAGPRYSARSDAGQRVLVPLLRALGERLDVLLLSHRDSDHTGGAAAVLAQQGGAVLLSSLEPDHPLLAGRVARRCDAGQSWEWDGVRFELLHPLAQDHASGARPNALSCVLRVQAQAGASEPAPAALLTGDIEAAQERALLQRLPPQQLRAQLLLAPHHGSRGSSSAAFIAAVAPRWALAQAGYLNRFGHPATEVLARYAVQGVQVVDSPRCGAARWRSAEPEALHCERQAAARYWHHRP